MSNAPDPRTPETSTADDARGGRVAPLLVATIVLLGSVGPMATDMYLPAFPHVIRDLHTSQGPLGLTLTAFFAGMALGQLVGGPWSDRVGRRLPLVAGTVALLLASVGCALAPNIQVMLAARLLQGSAAGWGMVIGRAVLIDVTHGPQLVRMMNLVMAIGSVAPLVAPLLGAALINLFSWRAAFWAIALMALLQLLGALFVVPESLPPEKRHSGGLTTFARNASGLLRRRAYMGYVTVAFVAGIALFSYVAQSPFVLQGLNHLSPTQYSLVFAANSCGIIAATTLSTRLAGRVPTRRVLGFGLCLQVCGGVLICLATALFHTHLWLAWPAFALLATGQGFVGGNSGALASQQATDMAGTASGLVGVAQSSAAALAPVLMSLLGAQSAWPVSAMMLAMPLLGLLAMTTIARPAGDEGSGS